MDDSRFSISAPKLYARLGVAQAPVVIDVRRASAFDADATMLIGAIRRAPDGVECWCDTLDRAVAVIAYCTHGGEVSQQTAATLRGAGWDARYLQGGIDEWAAQGLPKRNKRIASARWVTRARPKIDRIACPWLVRRFVNPAAEFLYVPTALVFDTAQRLGGTAYDIPGAEPFTHDGEQCSFDAFIKAFGIADRPLDRLALIVRGADTGRPLWAPQSAALLAVSVGLSAIHADDDLAMLEASMPVYDALYKCCRSAGNERHD